MQLLIIGFDEDQTRELSRHLRADGHAVLGAQGRHGARTFIHALTPDAVIIPEGPKGALAAGWLEDLAPSLTFVPVPPSEAALKVIARALGVAGSDDVEASHPGAVEDPPTETRNESPPLPGGQFERFDREPGVAEDDDLDDPDGDVRDDDADDDFDDDVAMVEVLAPSSRMAGRGGDSGAPYLTELPDSGPGRQGASPSASAHDDEAAVARAIHPDLASKLAHVRLGDYFSIVEVDPSASTWAIREAIERLGRRFSARGWPHRLHPEELEALDEISRGLADAMLVLGDEDLRMRYQRALAAAAQGITPGNSAR